MNGVIIIDEKQLFVNNISGIMTSWAGDKFTIRFETAKNEFHDGLTDDELVDRILVESNHEEMSAQEEKTMVTSEVPDNIHLAFKTSAEIPEVNSPTLPSTVRMRMSVEPPPKGSTVRATFGSAVIGVSREQQKQQRIVTADAPSGRGIIFPEKDSTLVGKTFSMAMDHMHIMNKMRRDLAVQTILESDTARFKNLKTNQALRSQMFTSMEDNNVRLALQTLVIEEQRITRGSDRENFLYVDVKPVLHVDSLTDETAGTGEFHFEEIASVYENPQTLRTKVDNGKD